ncbi:MAG: hypothetical protein CM1200mP2_58750 [Planctomycetaceae bacterium]|nr:MAG: hypothetical protein CM1200mP2_58750 [Planctomycetaceae bacterium]
MEVHVQPTARAIGNGLGMCVAIAPYLAAICEVAILKNVILSAVVSASW